MSMSQKTFSPCPSCEGPIEDTLPLKGQGKRCLACMTPLRWDPPQGRWMEIDPPPYRKREVIKYHARDLSRLPPLQLTGGGRLVQRCIACWDEVEIMTSHEIVIGYVTFVPKKAPRVPPPDWKEGWIPITKTQKGPGCEICLKDYTAYVGKRGTTESISKEGKRRVHVAPFIPVDKQHFADVHEWLASNTSLEAVGYKLLVGIKQEVPSLLGMKFLRSCEKRLGEPSLLHDLSPFGTGLVWDGPLALHQILPLKKGIDRFPLPLRQGLLVVVDSDHQKILQHLQTLKEGKKVVPCWGEDLSVTIDWDAIEVGG